MSPADVNRICSGGLDLHGVFIYTGISSVELPRRNEMVLSQARVALPTCRVGFGWKETLSNMLP